MMTSKTRKTKAIKVNLLPPEYRVQPVINPFRVVLVILVIIVSFTSFSYLWFRYSLLQAEIRHRTQLEFELALYQKDIDEYDSLEEYKNRVTLDRTNIELIKRGYPPYPLFMRGIAAEMPADLWLMEMTLNKDLKMHISGQSVGLEAITEFLNNLEQTMVFTSVLLKEVHGLKVDKEYTLYGFTIGLEGAEGVLTYGK